MLRDIYEPTRLKQAEKHRAALELSQSQEALAKVIAAAHGETVLCSPLPDPLIFRLYHVWTPAGSLSDRRHFFTENRILYFYRRYTPWPPLVYDIPYQDVLDIVRFSFWNVPSYSYKLGLLLFPKGFSYLDYKPKLLDSTRIPDLYFPLYEFDPSNVWTDARVIVPVLTDFIHKLIDGQSGPAWKRRDLADLTEKRRPIQEERARQEELKRIESCKQKSSPKIEKF